MQDYYSFFMLKKGLLVLIEEDYLLFIAVSYKNIFLKGFKLLVVLKNAFCFTFCLTIINKLIQRLIYNKNS